MKMPIFLSFMCLVGCSRQIDVEVKITVIDTGSSGSSETSSSQPSSEPSSSQPSNEPSNQPSSQPSNEPSNQPSNQPSGEPSNQPSGEPSNQPSGEPSNQPSGEPSNQPSGEPTNEPTNEDTSNPGDPGQQQGGGVDFCTLVQSYIDCGNSDGQPGLNYCDDPESAGNWLQFFDCLVEAGSTDCATLSDCSGMIP